MSEKELRDKLVELMVNLINGNTDDSLKEKIEALFKSENLKDEEILDILAKALSLANKEPIIEDVKMRVITSREVKNLTEDALKYLLSLKSENKITEDTLEDILTDISRLYNKIDINTLKEILDYKGINTKKVIN